MTEAQKAAVERLRGEWPVAGYGMAEVRADIRLVLDALDAERETYEEMRKLRDKMWDAKVRELTEENERLAKEHAQCHEWNGKLVHEHYAVQATIREQAEEIAEEWFKIHDGMCVRSIDGQPHREHFLAALREAAEAAREEEREAIRGHVCEVSIVLGDDQGPVDMAHATLLAWLDARNRAPKV